VIIDPEGLDLGPKIVAVFRSCPAVDAVDEVVHEWCQAAGEIGSWIHDVHDTGVGVYLPRVSRAAFIALLALVVTACGGDSGEPAGTTTSITTVPETSTTTSPSPETSTTTSPPPDTTVTGGPAVVVISEVVFGDEGYVAITNHGEANADLDGWQLCQRPAYFGLPAITLLAGETVRFALGDSSALEGNVVEMGRQIGQLRPGSGEVGLYRSGSFGDPEAIVSYVEWGEPDHGRSGTAVDAGVWVAGDFVPTTDSTTGITKTAAEPVGSGDWIASG
jgi:hypothetical protein